MSKKLAGPIGQALANEGKAWNRDEDILCLQGFGYPEGGQALAGPAGHDHPPARFSGLMEMRYCGSYSGGLMWSWFSGIDLGLPALERPYRQAAAFSDFPTAAFLPWFPLAERRSGNMCRNVFCRFWFPSHDRIFVEPWLAFFPIGGSIGWQHSQKLRKQNHLRNQSLRIPSHDPSSRLVRSAAVSLGACLPCHS
jgi:hypothetical protein